jgi:hypothetical protein
MISTSCCREDGITPFSRVTLVISRFIFDFAGLFIGDDV